MSIDKKKRKGLLINIFIPFYAFIQERCNFYNISMSTYINFLISKDVNEYIMSQDKDELQKLQNYLKEYK